MAGRRVQALYDFSGEAGSAELSIAAGEILTVTREDVGDGWWEGINQLGQTGLFPAAYVEDLEPSGPPTMPPPPLPDNFNDQEWGNQQSANTNSQNYESVEYWDDEWDDDSESGAPPPPLPSMGPGGHRLLPVTKSASLGDDISIGRSEGKSTVGRKNLNRFSTFVKTAGESYILGTVKINVPDSDKVYIIESDNGVIWSPIKQHYICMVASPKKESKLKGLKSFIAYQLTPTFNNIQVSRRYKHFDWLHERLEEKFSLIPIPPLPDKQISGRYEEQFIEHRKNQLQAFVDYVCRHPVLSRCSVWEHFMTCTDEKRWKPGKRKAEKDELVGAHYFLALQAPENPIIPFQLEQETEACSRFVHSMDGAVKNLMACSMDQTKKHQGPYKREYQKVGQAFYTFGQVFGMEESKVIGRSCYKKRDSTSLSTLSLMPQLSKHIHVWLKYRTKAQWLIPSYLGMPAPTRAVTVSFDVDLRHEQSCNTADLQLYVQSSMPKLTNEQKAICDRKIQMINGSIWGNLFDAPGGNSSSALTNAIKDVGDTYNEIGKMFEEQPKLDWEPLGDTLHIFKGILSAFPDILTVHKGALQKRKDCEKLTFDHKMESSQMHEVTRRTDVVSYALLAEINHFHNERTTEIRKSMKRFLEEQVKFYQRIVTNLETALSKFEE